jgi:hypothetical protein
MLGRRARVGAIAAAIVASAHTTAMAAPVAGPTTTMTKKACLQAADHGQDQRAASKLREARETFLTCAVDACPAVIRSDCARWVTELDGEIPSIVVRVTRAGSDLVGAKVSVDGVAVEAASDGKPIPLDPGTHTLVITLEGSAPVTQTLVVVTGERNRVVTVDVPSNETTTKTTTSSTTSTTKDIPAAPKSEESAHAPAWAWIAGGVGVVALGGFVFFALSGKKDISHAEDTCAPYCSDDVVNSAHRKLVIGDISLGVAVVALSIATYGFLSVPTSKSTTASVGVVNGGGVLSWRGTF